MGHAPSIDHDVARRAAEVVLNQTGSDGSELVIAASSSGVTRYAGSQIIQNTVRDEVKAYVRAVWRGRAASATTNRLDQDSLARTANAALHGAKLSPPDRDFPGLADPAAVGAPAALMRFDDATAGSNPEARALAVKQIVAATDLGDAAGVYETSSHVYAVFNTLGVDCHDAYTRCMVTCVANVDGATGWGEATSHSIEEVDPETAARAAVDKASAGRGAIDVAPGTYQVVLEPPAVAVLLEYLSYAGFGAKQVVEGDGFLAERAGDMVAAPGVTVADDVWHPGSIGIGFDFEGVPRKRVAVIDRGRATGPVTDLRTVRLLGGDLTGHYSGSNEYGPYASNVVLEPGERSLEELIAGVDEGLLVTRFHYVNVLDRKTTLLTGMTRDGTFRLSGGAIAEPVHNLRFVNSALDALSSVRAIGSQSFTFGPSYGAFGSTVAPALHLGELSFPSATSH